jgi:hypothetical protein
MSARARLCAALAALLCAAPLLAHAAAPSVETSVDRTRVARGDTLALRIRLRGAAAERPPDLAALDADFEVQGVQQTQRTSIVNGVVDQSVDWVVGLVPRRPGALVIPALPVGSASSEPIRIEVTAGETGAGADAGEAAAEPVRVEMDADRQDPYEHERVLLRVRLLAGVELLDGALGEPEISGAAVERLGGDRPISQEIAGRSYRGIERSYAVVPDASGELRLPSIRFEGHIAAPRPPPSSRRFGGSSGGSLFERFLAQSRLGGDFIEGFLGSRSLPVAARSQPLALHVRARPDAADGQWWLPARAVELKESFDPAPAELRVGEPLTRRIELRAEGASPAQLPPLALPDVPGLKQYAEAPSAAQDSRGSVRMLETTLIPTRPGLVTLPPLEIAWWDTQADAPRTATLPAHELEVLPAAGGGAPPEAPSPAAAAAAPPEPHEDAPPLAVESFVARHAGLVGACAALLVAVLLFGLRAAWRSWRPVSARVPSLRRTERALRRACLGCDAPGAEAALRAVGRALDPGALGFDAAAVQRLGGPELASEVARLHAARYSGQAEAGWQGRALWRSYRRARRRRWRRAAGPALPPLYPTPPADAAARHAG